MSSPSSHTSAADRSRADDGQTPPPDRGERNWPETDHPALTTLREGSAAEKEAVFRKLYEGYSPAIGRYIRHHWPLLQESDIDDFAAEFTTLCLTGEKAHLLAYDPQRPIRLRTYLCTILDNFLRNHRRRSRAKMRGGDRQFESLDTVRPAPHQEAPSEDAVALPGVDIEIYDRQWAQQLLSVAFSAVEKSSPTFREWLPILRPWILADPGDSTLKEIALEKGCTHASVRTHLHRLRKAWRQAIRDAVARTVSQPEDIDDELRHLATVLSRQSPE